MGKHRSKGGGGGGGGSGGGGNPVNIGGGGVGGSGGVSKRKNRKSADEAEQDGLGGREEMSQGQNANNPRGSLAVSSKNNGPKGSNTRHRSHHGHRHKNSDSEKEGWWVNR